MKVKKLIVLSVLVILLLTGCSQSKDTEPVREKDTAENKTSAQEKNTSEDTTLAPEKNTAGNTEPTQDKNISEGPESAQDFVNSMGIGWNLGNTLDPVDCNWVSDDLSYETAWGNIKTTRELISFVKSEGFDSIRIPVTWTNHVGEAPDYIIREEWMNRVQEIVDWCVEEDFYIILNMHHEGGWITKASTDYDKAMEKYKAIWSQIAERFGDYSQKLIFESMNEIGFDDLGTQKGCELLSKMNGEFTQLIRESGKNNKERYLLLAGYWTDIDRSCEAMVMPEDDKVILSVHYYSPAQFAIAEKGTSWGYSETWGTDEDFKYLEDELKKVKTHFINKGIPVIMGEYGCITKDKDTNSRILYLSSIVEYSLKYGVCPVLWDNGGEINRNTLKWNTERLADEIRKAKEKN